ncbi:hypothetical protein [Catenuloplanes japonicus]|uniref:hypothetical protein n=1 Tax=Catenuloplanes japonicus TaxID=33876 RepID=UPI000B254D14|nr:hypothetical protein [Catenuloplanes japonicus]
MAHVIPAAGWSAEDFIAHRRKLAGDGRDAVRRLDDELERLPRTDVSLALDVYTRLAESVHVADREAVAVRIDLLLAVSPDRAAAIWRTLLADSEKVIRLAAYETLELARDEVESGSADVLALTEVLPPADLIREWGEGAC